jgi:hypothetical protein
MVTRILVVVSVLAAFAAGVGAQRLAGGISMRGQVLDANTIVEPVEYWEVRSTTGESVVITGRNELPMMRWLRQHKNRSVVLTIEPSPEPSDGLADAQTAEQGSEGRSFAVPTLPASR